MRNDWLRCAGSLGPGIMAERGLLTTVGIGMGMRGSGRCIAEIGDGDGGETIGACHGLKRSGSPADDGEEVVDDVVSNSNHGPKTLDRLGDWPSTIVFTFDGPAASERAEGP